MITAINGYHKKLAHLLHKREAAIAAAIVFTIVATIMLVLLFNVVVPALVCSWAAAALATQLQTTLFLVYCSIVAGVTSLSVSGYSAYCTFFAVAIQGIGGGIRRLEDQLHDGDVVSPLIFPESDPPALAP